MVKRVATTKENTEKVKAQKVKKPKVKKVYTADELIFKTKPHLDFYLELKDLREEGIVLSFTVPTLDVVKQTKNKYSALKCEVDGHVFDSIMEAKYYVHLKKERIEGHIKDFELQPKFNLQESFKKEGKTVRAIDYIADFLVTQNDSTQIVYDVKGMTTKDFLLKKKMFDFKYRELPLKCIRYMAKEKAWVDINQKSKAKGA